MTIDENVNNVVDYSLESTYDIKILDPNFVKIFRLAQLSVEYLLYCRQYLDQSVIILKDDLKLKLEDNHKLKRELSLAEENIKELKEKPREKYKWVEKKFSDSNGEIHKCPHCPKTFISSVFMSSHLTRRHSNQSIPISSPVHEEYRAEAEKLHNEIKNLKERLNETERIIRSESGKLHESIENTKALHLGKVELSERQRIEEDYEKYREEMNNLRSILFSEIKSFEGTEKRHWEKHDERNELVKLQGEEIQRLRDQLQAQGSLQISNSQLKEDIQEHWQAKIQEIEEQHRLDMEKLNQQLILNQQTTDKMRMDYTSKISELEEKSRNYVDAVVQKESRETKILQRNPKEMFSKETALAIEDIDTSSGAEILEEDEVQKIQLQSKKTDRSPVPCGSFSRRKPLVDREKFKIEVKQVNSEHPKPLERSYPGIQSGGKPMEEKLECEKIVTSVEDINSESATISDSQMSQSESQDESESESEESPEVSRVKTTEAIKMEVEENFEERLRGLGVDPEWTGLPLTTFKQLIVTMAHHRAVSTKKSSSFKQIRQRISEKLTSRIPREQMPRSIEQAKSPLNRLMGNVTRRAAKSLRVLKMQESPSREKSKPKFSLRDKPSMAKLQADLLPKKLDKIQVRTLERREQDTEREASIFSPSRFSTPRYVPSPHQEPDPSKNVRQLFPSYESIKDYGKDLTGKMQQSQNRILGEESFSSVSVSQEKLDRVVSLPASPKGNRSLLKSMTGSVGSLVKKKVLFDLEENENNPDNYSRSSQISSTVVDSDDGVSSLSGEEAKPEASDNLQVSQGERRIEVIARQQLLGRLSNEIMIAPPMPAPRTSTSIIPSKNISSSRESNLDHDIEELLRMD
uniref:Dzip1_0 protein n=1 Tax=Fopius arisanus TaxID=64838 RepID=A0A0C9R5A2_9HYME